MPRSILSLNYFVLQCFLVPHCHDQTPSEKETILLLRKYPPFHPLWKYSYNQEYGKYRSIVIRFTNCSTSSKSQLPSSHNLKINPFSSILEPSFPNCPPSQFRQKLREKLTKIDDISNTLYGMIGNVNLGVPPFSTVGR